MKLFKSNGIPILCYHSIDPSNSVISVAPTTFAKHIKYLRENQFQSISLHDVTDFVIKRKEIPGKSVCIVFDDGYENNYTHAFPILKESDFKATIFVATKHCGKINDWTDQHSSIPRLPMLTWRNISEMSNHGIEFGSHTQNHVNLTQMGLKKAQEELIGANKEIEDHIGIKVEFASYPFGSYNNEIKEIVKSTFKAIVSTRMGKVHFGCDLHALRRINPASQIFKKLPIKITFSKSFDNYILIKSVADNFRKFLVKPMPTEAKI